MQKLIAFAAAAAVVTGGLLATESRADAIGDFYRGRNLTVIVPSRAGGVYATFGQLLRRHLPRHLPGNPTVVLQMMPGAGGVKASNFVYNVAPRDGLTISTLISGVASYAVLQPERVKYDPMKLNWLGGWGEAIRVLSLFHTVPVKTLAEARKKQVVLGTIGLATPTYQVPAMLNNLLGTKFKLVTGYRGGSPIRLAIERGELDGWAGLWLGWKARKPGWVRDKKLVHLLQVARKRAPDLPDTPTLLEFAKTEEQKKIFGFVSSTGIISRALSAPPGVPAARLAAIEKAYAATLRDPEFLKEAAKRRYPIQPTTAKEVQAAVRQVISLPPDLVKKVKAAMGFK